MPTGSFTMVARRGSLMICTKEGSSLSRAAASSNWSRAFSSGSSSFCVPMSPAVVVVMVGNLPVGRVGRALSVENASFFPGGSVDKGTRTIQHVLFLLAPDRNGHEGARRPLGHPRDRGDECSRLRGAALAS